MQAWDFITANILWGVDHSDLPVNEVDWGEGSAVRLLNTFMNRAVWNGQDFERNPVRTLGDLAGCSSFELLREPNFGMKSLDRVRKVLRSHGMKFKNE